METIQKMALLPIIILILTVVLTYAQPNEPPAGAPEASQEGTRFTLDESYVADLLGRIKLDDPNEAQRLENLREENPGLFEVEIRKLAWRYHTPPEGFEPSRPRREIVTPGPADESTTLRGRSMGHDRLHDMTAEFISWLEKNDPLAAKELAALKEKDPPAYTRRLSAEMKKYREIIDAEQTNPALAELLKKDLKLKQKRNELLSKLTGTTDEKQKEKLTAQLKEVVGDRIDIETQKKQLEYESLKKKLEQLQQDVNKSRTELENYKNNKEDLIKKDMDDLINKSVPLD